MSARHESHGFSLVELVVTILVLGLLMAFSVPAFQSLNQSNRLHGATENMAANLRLVREKAIATGQFQIVHFTMNYPTTWDYHVHNVQPTPGWDLPPGISYYTATISQPRFERDGRVVDAGTLSPVSGIVVLRNERGERDTVTIAVSGLVLTQ